MKRLVFILGLIVCLAHCAYADELLVLEDDLHAEFSVIEEKVKKISPALVASVANLPEMERLAKYQEYLVYRNFELLKSKYIMEFVIMAAVKGRKIKSSVKNYADPGIFEGYIFGDIPDGRYFLDNGEFDSEKCWKHNKKLGSYQACEFPEGYEKVVIEIRSIEGEKTGLVEFWYDDAESNTTKLIKLHTSVNEGRARLMHFVSALDYRETLAEINSTNSMHMKYGGWTEEYKEKLKKRNPELYYALGARQQALRDEKDEKPTVLRIEGGMESVFYNMGNEDASSD